MTNPQWFLVDTETTGIAAPVFVVEIAAQRMCGWEPEGGSFRKLLNQNAEIPPAASRLHGYTREILERDGEPAVEVYEALRAYVGELPLVSYNSAYDLDDVLRPEWRRLGVAPIGNAGFCALRLAQRLLDPVPAGNCKLQSLRQYYRLPERGAHTALGDVLTVADLFAQVLRPIAEQRGLEMWAAITAYAGEEWYPSRIAFGKHKGKSVWEALESRELREWLEGLARSSNARNARMGRWYMRRLEETPEAAPFVAWENADRAAAVPLSGGSLVLYVNPELQRLAALADAARERLARLEASFTVEKAKVDAMRARMFAHLREHFQRRDRLRIVIGYRQKYLDFLVRHGEEEAAKIEEEFRQASAQSEKDYEQAATALAKKKELSAEETAEVSKLWLKLVKLFHPDPFRNDPKKYEVLEKLTAAINCARDAGDLETLREIGADPNGFMLRKGWGSLDFSEEREIAQLRRLWESIELEIIRVLDALNDLNGSPDYELYRLTEKTPCVFR